MKHLQFAVFTFFLLLFSLPGVIAQQNHFIYIQTENKQPFYVKLENKVYSSSASGYLLIAKLKDGTYNLAIGFPKREWPEQNIVCTVDKNDIGYLLKNFGSKGWGLFNLQTLAVQMPVENEKVASVDVVNQTDAFSNMLSNVLNDSTIRQTETVKEDPKKVPVNNEDKVVPVTTAVVVPAAGQQNNESQTVTKSVAGKETKTTAAAVVVMNGKENTVTAKKEPVSSAKESKSAITRSVFNKNEAGTEMVYLDEVNGKRDTIRVFIPADKNSAPVITEKPKEVDKPKSPTKSDAKKTEKANDSKFLDIELPNPNQPDVKSPVENKETKKIETNNTAKKAVAPDSSKAQMINSDCKSFASEEDFLKLRKKMAAEDNEEDMIAIAKKTFKTKCFSVEQIKNLSVLFLKDAGKYNFFDAVYPYVSDSHNYSQLQSQLTETYYINRFQVMIRH